MPVQKSRPMRLFDFGRARDASDDVEAATDERMFHKLQSVISSIRLPSWLGIRVPPLGRRYAANGMIGKNMRLVSVMCLLTRTVDILPVTVCCGR